MKKLVYVNRSSIVSTELNPAIHLLPLLLHLKIRGNGGIVKKKKRKRRKSIENENKIRDKGNEEGGDEIFLSPAR